MSLEIINAMKNVTTHQRTQCDWTFSPCIYNKSKIILYETINTICPICNIKVEFKDNSLYECCDTCYEYSVDEYLLDVIEYINVGILNITDEKEFEYNSVDGTIYKHDIINDNKTYYCITFCGASYECNEWSSRPHDDFYYYTVIFINEDIRNEKYDDKDFTEYVFNKC